MNAVPSGSYLVMAHAASDMTEPPPRWPPLQQDVLGDDRPPPATRSHASSTASTCPLPVLDPISKWALASPIDSTTSALIGYCAIARNPKRGRGTGMVETYPVCASSASSVTASVQESGAALAGWPAAFTCSGRKPSVGPVGGDEFNSAAAWPCSPVEASNRARTRFPRSRRRGRYRTTPRREPGRRWGR